MGSGAAGPATIINDATRREFLALLGAAGLLAACGRGDGWRRGNRQCVPRTVTQRVTPWVTERPEAFIAARPGVNLEQLAAVHPELILTQAQDPSLVVTEGRSRP